MRDVKLAARGSNVAHKGVQSGPLDDFKKKEKSMRIYSRDGNHYYYCDKKKHCISSRFTFIMKLSSVIHLDELSFAELQIQYYFIKRTCKALSHLCCTRLCLVKLSSLH